MVAHKVTSDIDYVLRCAVAMVVDFSKFGIMPGKKYEESLGDPSYVCGFEMALSAVQLIGFDDPVLPVMDCVEKLPTHQIFHSRVVSVYFIT